MDTTTVETLAQRWGRMIEEKRKGLGMKQSDLADAAKTSQQNVSRIEMGSQAPSDALRVRIAGALGEKVGDLFAYGEETQ